MDIILTKQIIMDMILFKTNIVLTIIISYILCGVMFSLLDTRKLDVIYILFWVCIVFK